MFFFVLKTIKLTDGGNKKNIFIHFGPILDKYYLFYFKYTNIVFFSPEEFFFSQTLLIVYLLTRPTHVKVKISKFFIKQHGRNDIFERGQFFLGCLQNFAPRNFVKFCEYFSKFCELSSFELA
jgi:hypothetical protein